MVINEYKSTAPIGNLCHWTQVPRSLYYYTPSGGTKGIRPFKNLKRLKIDSFFRTIYFFILEEAAAYTVLILRPCGLFRQIFIIPWSMFKSEIRASKGSGSAALLTLFLEIAAFSFNVLRHNHFCCTHLILTAVSLIDIAYLGERPVNPTI